LVINRVRVLGSGPHTPTKFFWEYPHLGCRPAPIHSQQHRSLCSRAGHGNLHSCGRCKSLALHRHPTAVIDQFALIVHKCKCIWVILPGTVITQDILVIHVRLNYNIQCFLKLSHLWPLGQKLFQRPLKDRRGLLRVDSIRNVMIRPIPW